MGARDKLNKVSLFAAVGCAAILGGLTQSWAVFTIASAALIAGSIAGGDIRFKGNRRR